MADYDTRRFCKLAEDYFEFLITEFKFKLVRNESVRGSYIVVYEKKSAMVELIYDILDNAFYFYIYTKGLNPKRELFHTVFSKFEKIEFKKVLPDDKQFQQSLELNAILLRKHGKKIFKNMDR